MTRKRFSIIELLVVIAIISILASLILPALHRAKQMAHLTECMSNLRQLRLGYAAYADEYNDHIVGAWRGSSVLPGDMNINTALKSYIPDLFTAYGNNNWLNICPEWAGRASYATFGQNLSLGVTHFLPGGSTPVHSRPAKFYQLGRSSDLVLVGPDSGIDLGNMERLGLPGEMPWVAVPSPHMAQSGLYHGKGNFLFADGHVDTVAWNSNWLMNTTNKSPD